MTLKIAGAEFAGGRREPRDSMRYSREWGTPRHGALSPALTLRVAAYIEANLHHRCRTAELARVACLSKSHFSRLFTNRFGSRVQLYIMHRRVAMAQTLMRTDAPLCEIALSCGMTDQSHFSKQFKRIVGQSPAAWRRALR